MSAMVCGVDEGASGATATPARRAPRNTAAYSSEVPAQMAMASVGRMPALQGRGDAIHHRVEGGEGDAALALDQRRVPRALAACGTDQLAIAGEGAGEQLVRLHSAWAAPGRAGGTCRSLPSARLPRCSG
jgi:hypothetical protein